MSWRGAKRKHSVSGVIPLDSMPTKARQFLSLVYFHERCRLPWRETLERYPCLWLSAYGPIADMLKATRTSASEGKTDIATLTGVFGLMSTRPNNYSFISQVVADEIDAKASRETRLRIVACPDRAAEPDKFVAQAFCVIRSVCREASRLTVQGRLADTLDLGPPWPWRSRAGPDASRLITSSPGQGRVVMQN